MKKKITLYGFGLILLGALAACSTSKGWSIQGEIAGAPDDTKVALEGFNNGRWYLIDSLEVSKTGKFDYRSDEPLHYADIMRLSLGERGSIYFPVDSVDRVRVATTYDAFGSNYTVSGNPMSAEVMRVDSIVRAYSEAAAKLGVGESAANNDLARELAGVITSDTTGLVAYYALGKSVGGKLIFDPAENFGNRVYGAAAQVYSTYRPTDPRGAALRQAYFVGRQLLGKLPPRETTESVVEVEAAGLIDISRYDSKGKLHSLAELAKDGKVIVLSFTGYSLPSSPAYNSILNDLYELYHSKGLEIYQIAFDDDEVAWKQAAANLPWITVWNSPADGNAVLYSYNVGAVPLTYIIDRKGDIAARVIDPSELPSKVAKYF